MKLLIIVLWLGSHSLAFGQDFKEVLASMQRQYKDTENMHVSMDIKAYEKAGNPKPFFEQHAVVKRQGFNYAYTFGDMEMLLNDQCLLIIDHGSREITYRQRNEKSEQTVMNKFNFDLDSILSFYETPQYLGRKNGADKYRLLQKSGDVRQVDFEVQLQPSLIKQLSYTYTEGQLVTIDFVTFDASPVFTPDLFNTDRFVKRSKGKFSPVTPFSQYRMVAADKEEGNVK